MILYTKKPKVSTKKLSEFTNSVKWLDIKLIHKNQLHFYSLITNYQRNQENNSIYNFPGGIMYSMVTRVNKTLHFVFFFFPFSRAAFHSIWRFPG